MIVNILYINKYINFEHNKSRNKTFLLLLILFNEFNEFCGEKIMFIYETRSMYDWPLADLREFN